MKRFAHFIGAGLVLILLNGCVATMQSTWHRVHNAMVPPAEALRQRARDQERAGQYPEAIRTWQVVAQLDPADPQIPRIVKTLESAVAQTAERHFRKGVAYYKGGEYVKARHEFLVTVRFAPHHKAALDYLKVRLHTKNEIRYHVKRGDSLTRIASQIYQDPSKAFIIGYFNNLDPKKPLRVGQPLQLPILDQKYLRPRVDIQRLIRSAEKDLKAGRYDKVVDTTAKIRAAAPNQADAQRLADIAYYRQGRQLMAKEQYWAALERFKRVSPDYQGVNEAIETARRNIKSQAATEKLKLAKAYMKKGEDANVINVTEEILSDDPGNRTARELFNTVSYRMARSMLSHRRYQEALDLLESVDRDYKDTAKLYKTARAHLNSRAERYYRNGVKYFINEELERAIAQWELTLNMNPQHPKAANDIQQARQLLRKWRALDDTP